MDTAGSAPIGAPVYDSEGHVIGLIASNAKDMTSYSAKSLEAFLSMSGVEYRTVEQMKAETSARQEDSAKDDILSAELDALDRSALEKAISEVPEVEGKEYDDESVEALNEA